MAEVRFFFSKPVVTVCALMSASLLGSCSSVERTPVEQLTAVQTVTPLPKPGTETTAYALPTPVANPTSAVAALATETTASSNEKNNPAAAAIASATAEDKGPKTIDSARFSERKLPSTASALSTPAAGEMRQMPDNMVMMAAMESDFDTGEPIGLENLVAKRIIVPTPRPDSMGTAYANPVRASIIPASIMPTSLTMTTEKPTSNRPELDRLISMYAKLNGIPEALVHRVVRRESTYNPRAYHNGNYGLMQIRYNTAKGLGYEGPAEGLFDAETNLKYAIRYLRGAWMVADNENDSAVKLYASGYYYHAKRKGLLDTLGMR